jgi:hypothetical protein
MKLSKLMIMAGALLVSSAAMAEGGGDRTFERMMVANEQAMQKFAMRETNSDPVVATDAKDDKTEKM